MNQLLKHRYKSTGTLYNVGQPVGSYYEAAEFNAKLNNKIYEL